MKVAALLVSIVVGFVIGHYLLAGAAAAYLSILISYHLYLVLLVVFAEDRKALAMSPIATIGTHLAFVAFLLGFAYTRTHIPFFGLLSLFLPALAPFEAHWLFSGESGERPVAVEASAAASVAVSAPAADDYDAFQNYLRQEHREFRKPGRTVAAEFDFWLADRAKKRS